MKINHNFQKSNPAPKKQNTARPVVDLKTARQKIKTLMSVYQPRIGSKSK